MFDGKVMLSTQWVADGFTVWLIDDPHQNDLDMLDSLPNVRTNRNVKQ
jgi:hypothetical protein